MTPSYNSLQLANIVFTPLEVRNFSTTNIVKLNSNKRYKVLTIDMTKRNPKDKQTGIKGANVKLNRITAIPRTDAQAEASDIPTRVKVLLSTMEEDEEYKSNNAMDICSDISKVVLDFANLASPVDIAPFTSTEEYLNIYPLANVYDPKVRVKDK